MMSYGSVFVCREKCAKCGSLRNKGTHFARQFCYNGKLPVSGGGGGGEGGGGGSGLRCLTLTSMSRRLLHRRNDMRAGSRRECCFASL